MRAEIHLAFNCASDVSSDNACALSLSLSLSPSFPRANPSRSLAHSSHALSVRARTWSSIVDRLSIRATIEKRACWWLSIACLRVMQFGERDVSRGTKRARFSRGIQYCFERNEASLRHVPQCAEDKIDKSRVMRFAEHAMR